MPTVLRWVSVANPVTYGIACLRDGAIFGFGSMWIDAVGLLAGAVALFGVIGVVLNRRAAEL